MKKVALDLRARRYGLWEGLKQERENDVIINSKRKTEKKEAEFLTVWLPYSASVLPAACPAVVVHLLNWNGQQQTLGRPTELRSRRTLNSRKNRPLLPITLKTSPGTLTSTFS